MLNAFIYAGLRTPFGRHAGALAPVRPDDLAAHVIRELLARHGVPGEAIEDVILGNTNQAGEDSRNVARHAALLAGLPVTVPGQTVNRLCASGLAAVIDAARAVTCGEGELFVAGGVESMSRAPFVMAKAEAAYSRDLAVFDSTIGARFPNPKIVAGFGNDSMPQTGDNVAREYGISREQADRFAAASQARYEAARQAGFFAGEIAPVSVPTGRKTPPKVIEQDEHPRPDSDEAALARLKPLFEGGVVTAGNASGVNDGAAALLIGSAAAGERHGLAPMARILSAAAVGVEPRIMGVGPIEAANKLLARTGLSMADLDVIELNEAFAAQAIAVLRDLGVASDDPRVNPNGGAIALGHPLGMSGARIVMTAVEELHRTRGRYALAFMCIGVGHGIGLLLERV